MKYFKLITAVIAIALAVGGAFVTQAEDSDSYTSDLAMVALTDTASQLASYRTIPSDPASCTTFGSVPCNPNPITPNCVMNVQGQSKQLYDAKNCSQPLYYDPEQ